MNKLEIVNNDNKTPNTVSKDMDNFYKVLRETLKPHHATDTTIIKFITSYLVTRNINQSGRECNLNPRDAKYLFNQSDIYKAIEKLTESEVVKFGYDAAEVVERTKELAFFDPVALVNEDGTYKKNLRDIEPEARRVIKSLKVKNTYEPDMNGVPQYTGEIIEYTFWDKPRSLELLGREKDTFKKTTVVEHDVSKNAREFLLASAHRATSAIDEMRDVTVKSIEARVPDVDIVTTQPITITKPPGVL